MTITVENINYQLDIDNKTAVVISYQDKLVDVIIPEYVEYENEKYKVTSIGRSAFYGCHSLKSVTIPDSVTKIGEWAFYNCHCLQSITIPDSVTEIGDLAFYYCDNLKSITIPNGVTSIGNNVFENCQSLTSISLSNSVTKLVPFMFYRCGLESITIPDSVTSIGSYVFKHCPFKEIRIPKNCSEFYNCAFDTKMKVIIDENNPYYFSYQDFIFKFIDNENICLFKYQGNDSEVQIPEIVNYKGKEYKVIFIGVSVFSECKTLTSITIPDSVAYIGFSAFENCERLKSVNIGKRVNQISKDAFHKIGLTITKRYTEDGRLIAYKAFNADMTCRDFQYEEGKTFEFEGGIKLCSRGFHACINPLHIFSYYGGKIGKDIVIHEVYLSGEIDEDNDYDSKVCASKIEIGKRLTMNDINEIINNK